MIGSSLLMDWIFILALAVMASFTDRVMYRYALAKGYDTGTRADISSYNDALWVSEFAVEAMQWAVGNGIITGKYNETMLEPQGSASRAECATIIMRFVETYEK